MYANISRADDRARHDMRPFDAVLRDGRRVRLRPVTPADRDRLVAAFGRLSAPSRYRRFLRAMPRLTEADVRFLTDADPAVAQCAVTVVDAWQGVGLGRLLVETLLSAALVRGVDHMTGVYTRDNAAARLAARVGARAPRLRNGLRKADIPVSSSRRTRRTSGVAMIPPAGDLRLLD